MRQGHRHLDWADSDQGAEPDVVLASPATSPPQRCGHGVLRAEFPRLKIASVNVSTFSAPAGHEHPHGLSDRDFDGLFTTEGGDLQVHGYPCLIHGWPTRRANGSCVRGYKEKGASHADGAGDQQPDRPLQAWRSTSSPCRGCRVAGPRKEHFLTRRSPCRATPRAGVDRRGDRSGRAVLTKPMLLFCRVLLQRRRCPILTAMVGIRTGSFGRGRHHPRAVSTALALWCVLALAHGAPRALPRPRRECSSSAAVRGAVPRSASRGGTSSSCDSASTFWSMKTLRPRQRPDHELGRQRRHSRSAP